MNIYRNQTLNRESLPVSKFKRLPRIIEEKIWANDGVDSQVFLEQLLHLIGNYNFDKRYLKVIDDYSFELKTKTGKIIKVELHHGNMDFLPSIKVTEDNIEMLYEYLPLYEDKNLFLFDTDKQKDIKTGFIQKYYGYFDRIFIESEDTTTCITFYCPNPPASYEERRQSLYLVSDKLKEAIKELNSSDIIELYYTIANNLDSDIKSFEIFKYDNKSRDTIDKIKVSNRKIIYFRLTQKYGNGFLIIEEDYSSNDKFSDKNDNIRVNFDTTMQEFDLFKNELEIKLTR